MIHCKGGVVASEVITYEAWEGSVHERIRAEAIWTFLGYRKALFLHDLAWQDCERLMKDGRGKAIAHQLIGCVGSISANIEEGHGRGYGKQRDWFFSVALGSAREGKGWYWKGRHLLPAAVVDHRLAVLDEVIALIVTELAYQKKRRSPTR
jgi:four helix bundle protein